MNLSNKTLLKNKEDGFTIVELLIVIVIIGILATLVIVSYSGIQNRAKKIQNQTDAQAITKKAEAYAAFVDSGGKYPITAAAFATDQISALPTNITINPVSSQIATNLTTNGSRAASGTSTYQAFLCGAGNGSGLRVYYYDPSQATSANAAYADAGICP